MQRTICFLAAAVMISLATGCGSGSESSGGAQASATGADGSPTEALGKFLAAIKQGDDKVAEGMMTPLARVKTREADMVVTPPGRDTARFDIGAVEQLSSEAVNIAVVWTDLDENGEPHSDDITWMMRKTEEGWRVAGMGAKPFEDRARVYLNFEDPADMQAKLEQINQEFQRRAMAAQPQQPQQPPQRTAEAPTGTIQQ